MRTARPVLATALLALTAILGCDLTPLPSPSSTGKIKTVWLDLSGDPLLREKFSLLLRAELVGSGISVVDHGPGHAVLFGEITTKDEPSQYRITLIRQQVTSNGITKIAAFCPNMTTSRVDSADDIRGAPAADKDAFEKAADEAADKIKELYPTAKTFFLDTSGSLSPDPGFPAALSQALRSKGLTPASAATAALRDQPQLSVPRFVSNSPAAHINITLKALGINVVQNGTVDLPATSKAKLQTPADCPDAFSNVPEAFGDPLMDAAKVVAKQLIAANQPK